MYRIYRMSNNSKKPTNSGGIFGALTSAASAVTNAITGKNNKAANKKNTGVVAPVTNPYTPPGSQNGGNGNMQQPSYAVMKWATTADAPTPTGPQMRNVAHGGKRRTHRKRSVRSKHTHLKHRKSHKKHTRRHTKKHN